MLPQRPSELTDKGHDARVILEDNSLVLYIKEQVLRTLTITHAYVNLVFVHGRLGVLGQFFQDMTEFGIMQGCK